jgi:hypothetical protein
LFIPLLRLEHINNTFMELASLFLNREYRGSSVDMFWKLQQFVGSYYRGVASNCAAQVRPAEYFTKTNLREAEQARTLT